MTWLTWRQFRTQALTALIILAAAAMTLLVTGIHLRHTYAGDLAGCAANNDCNPVLNQFQRTYDTPLQLADLFMIATPGLIGVFWGAPLIGRELETGTHQLVWNQSITRTRWLAIKLAGVGLAAMAFAGLLSLLITWWSGPLVQLADSRFSAMAFASSDVAPLGYAAFAFALGTIAGLLLRRSIPAMAVTLAVFTGMQILMPAAIRPNLLPSTTTTIAINQSTMSQADGMMFNGPAAGGAFYVNGLPVPRGAWVMSSSAVETPTGQAASQNSYSNCFQFAAKPGFDQIGACLAGYNLHADVTYQPAGNYWPLQWYETGIYLALAALSSGFCFWWIRCRRD